MIHLHVSDRLRHGVDVEHEARAIGRILLSLALAGAIVAACMASMVWLVLRVVHPGY